MTNIRFTRQLRRSRPMETDLPPAHRLLAVVAVLAIGWPALTGPPANSLAFMQPSLPSDHFSSISSGALSSCGIEPSGHLVCWGDDQYGESDPPAGSFSVVSVGSGGQPCAIRRNGQAICWGGFGVPRVPHDHFTQLSSGFNVDCGITVQRAVACWRRGGPGNQLRVDSHPGRFLSVGAGFDACGVRDGGTMTCWGTLRAHEPTGSFLSVAVGVDDSTAMSTEFACGVRTDHQIACWGDAPAVEMRAPAGAFTQVTTGGALACGLRTTGRLICWGHAPPAPSGSFVQVSAGGQKLSAGGFFVCGLKAGGAVVCTGDNTYGETDAPGPPFVEISDYCGLRVDGTLTCWGGSAWSPAGSVLSTNRRLFGALGCNRRVHRRQEHAAGGQVCAGE